MIKILHHSKEFVAVDKIEGISIHNTEDPENLLTLLSRQLGTTQLYPVHRLDKETSGVQVFALNESAARDLASQFQTHSVNKIYWGVLRGTLKTDIGIWNAALTDKSEGRKNPLGLSKDRIPCETRFQLKNANRYFSLCEFQLITGRQHQIRKHAAVAKHALIGDPRYGDPKYNQRIAEIYGVNRMFLHCHQIKISGIQIESSMPACFEHLISPLNPPACT